MSDTRTHTAAVRIVEDMREALAARKCHACGCFHDALGQLSDALPSLSPPDRERLTPILHEGNDRVVPREYDCLGCDVCWPANALNTATEACPDAVTGGACPTEVPTRSRTWPPLPGEYRVLDAGAHVAVCVLTSKYLLDVVMAARPPHVAIVGTLSTENLGIERVISNMLANPNLTTLVVCGADSRRRIGHLPGQSLLSLMEHGTDERGRIHGAKGRRPVLRNLPPETVETFRRTVTVIDRLGEERTENLLDALDKVPSSSGSQRTFLSTADEADVLHAGPPPELVLDPSGYFVLFPDRMRHVLLVEHYSNDGTLRHALTGRTAHELYAAVIDEELVSRLDHAAYLGMELARAERCLETGEPYVQDRAPEPPCGEGCGCHPTSEPEGA